MINRRRLFLSVLAAGLMTTAVVNADIGIGAVKSTIIQVLDDLGVTTNGVYSGGGGGSSTTVLGTTDQVAVTTIGNTATVSLAVESGNKVAASPSNGSSGAMSARALVAADIPNISATKLTSGLLSVAQGGTGFDASAAANGKLPIGNGSGFTLANILGVTNRTVITNGSGTITVNLYQDLNTTSSPTFAAPIITGLLTTSSLYSSSGISSSQDHTDTSKNEIFGNHAVAAGGSAVALGNTASSAGAYAICVGYNASAGGNASVNIGALGHADLASCVLISGYQGQIWSHDCIGLGYQVNAGQDLSAGVTTDNNPNTFTAGSSSSPMNKIFFGKGIANATPTQYAFYGTAGVGAGIGGTGIDFVIGQSGDTATAGGNHNFYVRRAATGQTASLAFTIGSTGISNTLGQGQSESFGAGATTNTTSTVSIGYNASCVGGTNGVAVGQGSAVSGPYGVALGSLASTNCINGGVSIGYNSIANGTYNGIAVGENSTNHGSQSILVGSATSAASGCDLCTVMGDSATLSGTSTGSVVIGSRTTLAGHVGCIVLGDSATATAANQFVAGSSTTPITDVWFGNGVSGSAPATLHTEVSGRQTAQTGADTNVVTRTVGSADGSFIISSNVLVTAAVTASFSETVTYTDESNASRTLTLTFSNVSGTFLNTITNVTGTGAYEGVPVRLRCKSGTTIVIATTGTFTSVTYNVEAGINQIG